MLKKREVVILPTDEKSIIHKQDIKGRELYLMIPERKSIMNLPVPTQTHHLYILSDEKIELGDWYVDLKLNQIFLRQNPRINECENFKKIIATTDKSLKLPQPSLGFINEFIAHYNAETPINHVMVEYEEHLDQTHSKHGAYIQKLKVNPKDNTITIRKVKDNFTRAEAIEIYKQGARDYCNSSQDIKSFLSEKGDGTKWIEEKL